MLCILGTWGKVLQNPCPQFESDSRLHQGHVNRFFSFSYRFQVLINNNGDIDNDHTIDKVTCRGLELVLLILVT